LWTLACKKSASTATTQPRDWTSCPTDRGSLLVIQATASPRPVRRSGSPSPATRSPTHPQETEAGANANGREAHSGGSLFCSAHWCEPSCSRGLASEWVIASRNVGYPTVEGAQLKPERLRAEVEAVGWRA
jgi:hypothetical protein